MKNKEFYKHGLETMAENEISLIVDEEAGFPTSCSLSQACRCCLLDGDCTVRRKKWLDVKHTPLNKKVFYLDDLTDEEKGFINALRYKGGYFYRGHCDLVNFNYEKPKKYTFETWSTDHPEGDIALKQGLFSFIDINTCWEYDPWNKKFIELKNK